MKSYSPFLKHLQNLLASQTELPDFSKQVESAVNGLASSQLENLVSRAQLKKSGAFFSSPELSRRVACELKSNNRKTALVVDPACGAGNLLLAAASDLAVAPTLSATLKSWGTKLAGFDIHDEFVKATHLRLALYACHRGAKFDLPLDSAISDYFPNIKKADGTVAIASLQSKRCHILLNPPYAVVKTPQNYNWISGNVNQAAVFLVQCIEKLKPQSRITAILPDVLRSGTRYAKWRNQLEEIVSIKKIESVGNFITADVDVFVIDLEIDNTKPGLAPGVTWWEDNISQKISDNFHVSVGAVVKHRINKNDKIVPYIHAKGLPQWGEITNPTESVAFSGRIESPPFVVIRRTSSPSDKKRAIATIVTGKRKVAIDNHLLICTPKAGGYAQCKKLIGILKDDTTNLHLNNRIRCRHLTVGVVKDIPAP